MELDIRIPFRYKNPNLDIGVDFLTKARDFFYGLDMTALSPKWESLILDLDLGLRLGES